MSINSTRADDAAADAKAQASAAIGGLKDQASQAVETARGTLSGMAADARGRLNDAVDQQKTAGADQLAGIAKAVQSAASDLQDKSPQVARLVGDAASSVDRFATDLRSRDIRDVLDQVTGFARQQPVAFFAGSVLAGLLLARFLKSETGFAPAPRGLPVDDGHL